MRQYVYSTVKKYLAESQQNHIGHALSTSTVRHNGSALVMLFTELVPGSVKSRMPASAFCNISTVSLESR